jgi:hypothetical protein
VLNTNIEWGEKRCLEKFVWEAFRKAVIWEIEDIVKVDLREKLAWTIESAGTGSQK